MTDVETLQERVRELEATLGLADDYIVAFDLSPVQRKVLGLMMQLPHVTPEMIEFRLGIATAAKVAMYRLRRRLKPLGIEIKSRRNIGYWLDPKTKELVRSLVTEKSNTKLSA